MVTLYTQKISGFGSQCAGGLVVIESTYLNFVTLCFSVFTLFENNSKCLGDALSLMACANEPAERRRSAGEAAENSAARRMAYAKKFSIEL